MTAPAQDYGEPWKVVESQEGFRVVGQGHDQLYFDRKPPVDRAAACVNALEGCPDPEATMMAVRAVMAGAASHCEGCRDGDPIKTSTYGPTAGSVVHLTDDGGFQCSAPHHLSWALNDPALAWLREKIE